jgi:membrane-associated protease RseP (regulator of RpoE activity)
MKTLLGLLFGIALGVVVVLASMTCSSLKSLAPAIFAICVIVCLAASYVSPTIRVSAQRLFGVYGIGCIPSAAAIWLSSGTSGPHVGIAIAFAVMILMFTGVISLLIAFFLAKPAHTTTRSG